MYYSRVIQLLCGVTSICTPFCSGVALTIFHLIYCYVLFVFLMLFFFLIFILCWHLCERLHSKGEHLENVSRLVIWQKDWHNVEHVLSKINNWTQFYSLVTFDKSNKMSFEPKNWLWTWIIQFFITLRFCGWFCWPVITQCCYDRLDLFLLLFQTETVSQKTKKNSSSKTFNCETAWWLVFLQKQETILWMAFSTQSALCL